MKKDNWTNEELDRLRIKIKGTLLTAGLDEVGRGPLAGPVVACAIIMPGGKKIEGVKDSKKLTEKKREGLFKQIIENALACSLSYVEAGEIDRINIRQATLKAMKNSVLTLKDKDDTPIKPDLLIIDAEKIDLHLEQVSLPKADDRIYAVSCASIVAKVIRDRYMKYYGEIFPQYSFSTNKGYGTKAHMEAIKKYGLLPIHRRTFIHGKDLFINEQKTLGKIKSISYFFPTFKLLREDCRRESS